MGACDVDLWTWLPYCKVVRYFCGVCKTKTGRIHTKEKLWYTK